MTSTWVIVYYKGKREHYKWKFGTFKNRIKEYFYWRLFFNLRHYIRFKMRTLFEHIFFSIMSRKMFIFKNFSVLFDIIYGSLSFFCFRIIVFHFYSNLIYLLPPFDDNDRYWKIWIFQVENKGIISYLEI